MNIPNGCKIELIALFKAGENLYRPQFIINGQLIEAVSPVSSEVLHTNFSLEVEDIKELEA